MTYEAAELSVQSGAPVELYQFVRGSTYYRYTSAEADVADTDVVWTSTAVERSAIEVTPERVRNALSITVPRNNPVADLFRISPPTDVVAVTVYRYHREDLETIVMWMGRVLGVNWQGAKAELNCEPVSTSAKRNGLRPVYQKNCRHVLFGTGCRLNRDDYKIETTVSSISGKNLSVDDLLNLPYAGGYLEWEPVPGSIERRFIVSADTDGGLVLNLPFQGISVSDPVTVYPGCAHDTLTCNDVYGNLLNFGGQPFIPLKNPFGGDPIY